MLLKVKVFPDSPKEVWLRHDARILLYLREPAEKNRANIRACQAVAEQFGIDARLVRLVKGHRGPNKTFELPD